MSLHFGIADQIAAVIGPELAEHLLAARGGTQISIPAKTRGAALAKVIGEEATARMIAAFGPGKLTLPMGAASGRAVAKQRAMAMLAAGASLSDIAQACRIHVRTVSRYKAERVKGKTKGKT